MRRHSLFPFRRGHDPPVVLGGDQRGFIVQPASRNHLALGGILVSICLGMLLVAQSGQTSILQRGASQRGAYRQSERSP
ncbi:hypothetical protein [Reticulibacter mediterranei]|uniref:hypothetical protein n=1 Tax=Reticulibacter mediterranei TaxID=2778369 RepID=UPI001C68B62F|nr:hypothetical protein [Reticulibacter mediterranei]